MLKRISLLLILLLPLPAMAELVIVTGNQSLISSLTDNEVRQLFSGQLRSLMGRRVQPLDLSSRDSAREQFYQKVMGRTPDQMRAYWTRLIFTGQGQPPREVSNIREMETLLMSSAEYIGYLPESSLTGNMRVLYRIR